MNKLSILMRRLGCAAMATTLVLSGPVMAQTKLGDLPPLASVDVPGNLALALSVEFPTAVSNTHLDKTYQQATTYIGYFDPDKCYTYQYSAVQDDRYFQPAGLASNHACVGKWSGNFLNWATMQTIDPFRWALTGGYRVVDTEFKTVLEKANASGQGGTGNFPDRTITANISSATPLAWGTLKLRIQGLRNKLFFTSTGDNNAVTTGTQWGSGAALNAKTVYEVDVRVRVCDDSQAAGKLEANCVKYKSSYKPEGLVQRYSDKIRFSAFGYLNEGGNNRDGGVMRAAMKYVGPTVTEPGMAPKTNAVAEWDATTGVMVKNPDKTDADSTAAAWGISIADSGVMNYVNKFGQIVGNSYKSNDPVGELYYATLRYFRNLGNVASYSNPNTTDTATRITYADGFPVITNWKDPILYSCQKNFVLGIGDVNTHADRNLPGKNTTGKSEPAKPAEVTADTGVDAMAYTSMVGALENISPDLAGQQPYNGCCSNNGALMAGLAYHANTQDIRPDLTGKQTVKTYWLDVLEYQTYKPTNQFYLATKYGGFKVPDGYDVNTAKASDFANNVSWWHTGPDTDVVGTQLRPDTYYTSAKADQMVVGLTSAFASIVSDLAAPSSSFRTASNIVPSGTTSYGSNFDPKNWTGNVWAAAVNEVKEPIVYDTVAWNFQDRLYEQTGGDASKRRIVTYRPDIGRGVSFQYGSLNAAQKTAIDPTWTDAADGELYLNWLRGDQSQEQNAVDSNSSRAFRVRQSNRMVADIGQSGVVVLGPPESADRGLSSAANPGYAEYASTYSNRTNIVVAAANNGMVHVINGAQSPSDGGGTELFAFVPNATFAGPDNTPSVSGLAAVGKPKYDHRYLINGNIALGDVDFKRTDGSSLTKNEWHSIAVGTLGKGGRSVYALDLTTALDVKSEADAVNRVMWEFTDPQMGLSFGKPVITRLAKYGWVVVVGSGMNTSDGKGAFYILNARTGAVIKRIALPSSGTYKDDGTTSAPTGLAYIEPSYLDRRSMEAEALYAGDLHGNVWRLDVSSPTGDYLPPVKIAKLTDANNNELNVTSRAIPVVDSLGRRWVVVGTGRLYTADDTNDLTNNRIYAIRDGNETGYFSAAQLPPGVSWPILESNKTRHDLQDYSLGIPLANDKVGYFLDLTANMKVAGYRVVIDPATNPGIDYVAFSASLPRSGGDGGCSGTALSQPFAFDLVNGTVTKYTLQNWFVTDIGFVTDQKNGEVEIAISGNLPQSGGPFSNGDTVFRTPNSTNAVTNNRLINWREIPLRN